MSKLDIITARTHAARHPGYTTRVALSKVSHTNRHAHRTKNGYSPENSQNPPYETKVGRVC